VLRIRTALAHVSPGARGRAARGGVSCDAKYVSPLRTASEVGL